MDIVPENVIQAGGDNSGMLQIILIAVLFWRHWWLSGQRKLQQWWPS